MTRAEIIAKVNKDGKRTQAEIVELLSKRKQSEKRKQKQLDEQKRMLFFTIYKTHEDPYLAEAYRITAELGVMGQVLEEIDLMFIPSESCQIDRNYINSSIHTMDDIRSGWDGRQALNKFIDILYPYIDSTFSPGRIILCGWGNHGCDDILLKKWFTMYGKESDYFRLFYNYSVDMKGASSVFFVDVVDSIRKLTLEAAVTGTSKTVNFDMLQVPSYRVHMINNLFYSRFAPTTHIHTRTAIVSNLNRNRFKLNNTKFYEV